MSGTTATTATNVSLSDFNILKTIGSGSFSSVYKVERKQDHQIYALKKVKLSQLSSKEKDNALNEIRILASINSAHIIRYKDAFYDTASGSLCIIMEYAANGDLNSKLKILKSTTTFIEEQRVWKYANEILQGLKTLHELKILHRDLKSANIFLGANDKVKLGDLNVSKITKRDLAYTQTGTPYYTSPEVWQNHPYDAKCDIWSMGCVLYELMAQHPPFVASSMEELYRKICKGSYPKLPSIYSAEMNEFIERCLRKSPKNRPTAQQLLEEFREVSAIKKDKSQDQDDKENKVPNQASGLLQTMKMPFGNLAALKKILPKPQFEDSIDSFMGEQYCQFQGDKKFPQRPTSAAHNSCSNKNINVIPSPVIGKDQLQSNRNGNLPIGPPRESVKPPQIAVSQPGNVPPTPQRQRIYSANNAAVILRREQSNVSVSNNQNKPSQPSGIPHSPKIINNNKNVNSPPMIPKSPETLGNKRGSVLQRNAIEAVNPRKSIEEVINPSNNRNYRQQQPSSARRYGIY